MARLDALRGLLPRRQDADDGWVAPSNPVTRAVLDATAPPPEPAPAPGEAAAAPTSDSPATENSATVTEPKSGGQAA